MHWKMMTVVLMTLSVSSFCQRSIYKGFPSLVWPKLYETTFVKSKDQNGEFDKPVFAKATKEMNGMVVNLPGYMVPFENGIKGSHFMLSSMPLNACFFCGVGGPETVVEVFLKKEATYDEKPIEVKGVLKLNDSNPDQMIYILEQAEITGRPGL